MKRRFLIAGGAALLAAPSIVRVAANIMPVSVLPVDRWVPLGLDSPRLLALRELICNSNDAARLLADLAEARRRNMERIVSISRAPHPWWHNHA